MGLTNLQQVAQSVKDGTLVVYPTDTLYALGASILKPESVRRVFSIKQRPKQMPLPVAVASIDDVETIAYMNEEVKELMKSFLPGKLTIILLKKNLVSSLISSQKESIAVRIPDDDIALSLLSLTGPLTVTSANVHGAKTPESVDKLKKVFKDFNDVIYLDGGNRDNVASTIVDMTEKNPVIVREGAITKQQIEAVIKE